MKSPPHPTLNRRQQGITLIMALILLVLLTLLGASVATNNTLQERMAGNTRNRDLAFQAAEFALKSADSDLNTSGTAMRGNIDATMAGACTSAAGFLCSGQTHDNTAYYWNKPGGCAAGDTDCFHWDTAGNYVQPTGITSTLVAAAPKYVVEQMSSTSTGSPATTKYYFRVTARGEGKASDAVVILQAMYQFQ